jgi:hypothetical protein
MRLSSIVVGLGHLGVGTYLAHTASNFGAIYAELFSGEVALPVLTRIVLLLAPTGWIAYGIVAAALLIGKDWVSSLRRIPNWPFAVALLVVGMGAVIGLFLPMVIIIQELGTT